MYFSLQSLIARNRVKQWDPKIDSIDFLVYWEKEKKKWSLRKILLLVLVFIFSFGSYKLASFGW